MQNCPTTLWAAVGPARVPALRHHTPAPSPPQLHETLLSRPLLGVGYWSCWWEWRPDLKGPPCALRCGAPHAVVEVSYPALATSKQRARKSIGSAVASKSITAQGIPRRSLSPVLILPKPACVASSDGIANFPVGMTVTRPRQRFYGTCCHCNCNSLLSSRPCRPFGTKVSHLAARMPI